MALRNGRTGQVGCFSVEVELTNHDDAARHRQVLGRVDTGADLAVLPARLVTELGLPTFDRATVRLANGSEVDRQTAVLVLSWTEPGGKVRRGLFEAVVEPDVESDPASEPGGPAADMLIGAMVLERWDVYADCNDKRLVPRVPGVVTCRV